MDIWEYLKTASRPIYLYGMGNGAEKIYERLQKLNVNICGVFASDGFVRRKKFLGFDLLSFDEAYETAPDMIALLSFGSSIKEVVEYVKQINKKVELYAPDVPVYGDGTFNTEFYNAHFQEFCSARDLLADDASRKVFDNIISYKLSGKLQYLFDCETSEKDDWKQILKLGDNEIFFDIGAYKGDTALEFINRTGGKYNSITAVEPNPKNYKKLAENLKVYKKTTAINAAVSNVCGSSAISFAGRGSHIASGECLVDTVTVDKLSEKNIPTYIKADVEGGEANLIVGAAKIISVHKPKLKIAAYHRNEDLFSIPIKINALNGNYKIYLRHNPCVPAWDTDYYFI